MNLSPQFRVRLLYLIHNFQRNWIRKLFESMHAWIQIISGSSSFGNYELNKADGLGIEDLDSKMEIKAMENCEFFIFRLSENM